MKPRMFCLLLINMKKITTDQFKTSIKFGIRNSHEILATFVWNSLGKSIM